MSANPNHEGNARDYARLTVIVVGLAVLVLVGFGVNALVDAVSYNVGSLPFKLYKTARSEVLSPGQVAFFIVLFMGTVTAWVVRELLGAFARSVDNFDKSEEAKVAADKLKKVEEALAVKTEALAAWEAQQAKDRQQLREEVEEDWQRDTQAKIEREHKHYLGYVERQRMAKIEYEAAKGARAYRILQLEEFVRAEHPEFAHRTDPVGQKGPELVAAAFRKHVIKKRPDAGLLRLSTDPEVLSKLGSLADFPAAPPPIAPPTFIPIPENLRRRFGSEQSQTFRPPADT